MIVLTEKHKDTVLIHYGTKRHSGRYPWGSGERPYQDDNKTNRFKRRIEKNQNKLDKQTAKSATKIAKMESKANKADIKIAKLRKKAMGRFTSDAKAEKLMTKVHESERKSEANKLKANKLQNKMNVTQAKIDKDNAKMALYEKKVKNKLGEIGDLDSKSVSAINKISEIDKELNVIDTAKEYTTDLEMLCNTYVYDDGVVKGVIRICDDKIEKLYVEPAFQNQGIGEKLLNYAVNCKNTKWLWVLEYNKRGIAFYKRNGFEFTGEKIIEDEWVPLWKMSRYPDVRLKIISQDSPEKAVLDIINEEAFPTYERTSLYDLYNSGKEVSLDIIGIYKDDELSGFFAVRKFERIRYLAYFAICSQKRSQGTGSKALNLLKQYYTDCQIITEFETPDDNEDSTDIRIHRRNFYLQNNFYETGWYNFYDGTEFSIACTETEFDIQSFCKLIKNLNSVISVSIPLPYQK